MEKTNLAKLAKKKRTKNVFPRPRLLYDSDVSYDEAKQDLIDSGIEEEEISDGLIYSEIEDMQNRNLEIFEYELENFENSLETSSFIAYGDVGLWHGVYRGYKKFNSLKSAIDFITRDCNYYKIFDINGSFRVVAACHDGRHCITIKNITKKGEEYFERWKESYSDSRKEVYVYEQIINKYSRHLHFGNKVYGLSKKEYLKPTKENVSLALNINGASFYS